MGIMRLDRFSTTDSVCLKILLDSQIDDQSNGIDRSTPVCSRDPSLASEKNAPVNRLLLNLQ